MKTNERFLAALKNMNSIMKDDVKAGRKWRYSNSSSKQAHTFKLARQKGEKIHQLRACHLVGASRSWRS